jgi:integrase/recombinase XerD
MLAFAKPGMDGAQQGCNLPGPYGGVSCGACVGFAPRALLAANSGFTYWRISIKVGSPPKKSDEALLKSWLRSLGSQHTQRNFEVTARRFLAELPEGGLRAATVEDVRDALTSMSTGLSEASARQYVLRIKSLLGYAHALGYTPFNAGATIKVRSNAGNRGATLAKRIITEVEVGLLIRAAPSKRDSVLLEVIYAGGLRVSETVALTWSDVLTRDERVQLSIPARAARCARCSCPRSLAGRCCRYGATPASTIPCSPAARADRSQNVPSNAW